jgi:hypothetical protein
MADKKNEIGATLTTIVRITDNKGSGPFELTLNMLVTPEREKVEPREKPNEPPIPPEPKAHGGPSRPDIKEVDNGPDKPPLTIEKIPGTERLQLVLNKTSGYLEDAKRLRPKEEEPAVEFVFKFGLALTAMGLLDAVKNTEEWKNDESSCREKIQESAKGIARVIVPLCLSLPKKLPKTKD